MTLHVEIINPYPATTVKELLETKLLIPRKIRQANPITFFNMSLSMEKLLIGRVLLKKVIGLA